MSEKKNSSPPPPKMAKRDMQDDARDMGNLIEDNENESSKNVFDVLPNEVLLMIFSKVDMSDPANFRILQVDSRFRRLCSSSITRLTLSSDEMSVSMGKLLLSLSPQLKSLTVSKCDYALPSSYTSTLARHALRQCPILEDLDVTFGREGTDAMTHDLLGAIAEYGHGLRCVNFQDSDLTSGSPAFNAKCLRKLENIKLSISVHEANNKLLMALAKHCQSLTKLCVQYSTTILPNILDLMKDRIKDLEVADRASGSTEFYVALGQCKNLRRLFLYQTGSLDKAGILAIAALPHLECLNINGADQLDGKDFARAFKGKKLCKLFKLELSYCKGLDDDALDVIAKACSNLKCLELTGCDMLTDVGIRKVVVNCKKLEKLDIGWLEKVTGTLAFQDVAEYLPSLSSLALDPCNAIIAHTAQYRNLHTLHLQNSSSLDREVLQSILMLPNLKNLTVSSASQLQSEDFISAFYQNIPSQLYRLQWINCIGLDDAALQVMAQSCRKLVHLTLEECELLTDVGIRCVVVNCEKLEEFRMCTLPKLTGTVAFQDVRLHLPKLRKVNFLQCEKLEEGCRTLLRKDLGYMWNAYIE